MFDSGAYHAELKEQRSILNAIAVGLEGCPVRTQLVVPADGESSPWLEVKIDEARLGRTTMEVCRQLRNSRPAIYVGQRRIHQGTFMLFPLLLHREQIEALVQGLRSALSIR
jgi:hypothetical protein